MKKEKNIIIFLSLISIAIIVLVVLFWTVFQISFDLCISFSILFAIILLVIGIILKTVLTVYNLKSSKLKLLKNKNPIINKKTKTDILTIQNKLKENKFIKEVDDNEFLICSKLHEAKSKIIKGNYKFEIFAIIKNGKIDYNDNILNQKLEKIMQNNLKGKKRVLQSIVILKQFQTITPNVVLLVDDQTFFTFYRKDEYVIIPVAISEKQIYYLNSKIYSPSGFYKETIKLVEKVCL